MEKGYRMKSPEPLLFWVEMVVTILWNDKWPGDLSDVAALLVKLEDCPVKGRHPVTVRPRVSAALRALKRRKRVTYVRRRGWVPGVPVPR